MNDRLWEKYVGEWFSAQQRVTIYLASGIKLQGVMQEFDSYSIVFPDKDGLLQLINRDNIATIMPVGEVEMMGRAR